MKQCMVRRCKNKGIRCWPLLAGEPTLCSFHEKNPPKGYWQKIVEEGRHDQPDDFDIPDEDPSEW